MIFKNETYKKNSLSVSNITLLLIINYIELYIHRIRLFLFNSK